MMHDATTATLNDLDEFFEIAVKLVKHCYKSIEMLKKIVSNLIIVSLKAEFELRRINGQIVAKAKLQYP